jgi:NAD(P)-dependent dehydrogenase (short-subunit alcohol dehydrogenase family)
MSVALVSGGGRGIGANIARELAAAGMDVIVTGRTREQVERVAAETDGRALVGDGSEREDVEHWASEAGDVDLLVCNAGIAGPHGPFGDADEWWRTFEVNVLGVYLCCRAFAPRMLERGSGRIVNVASGAAYLPVVGQGARRPRTARARPRCTASPSCWPGSSRRRTSSSSRSRPGSSGRR